MIAFFHLISLPRSSACPDRSPRSVLENPPANKPKTYTHTDTHTLTHWAFFQPERLLCSLFFFGHWMLALWLMFCTVHHTCALYSKARTRWSFVGSHKRLFSNKNRIAFTANWMKVFCEFFGVRATLKSPGVLFSLSSSDVRAAKIEALSTCLWQKSEENTKSHFASSWLSYREANLFCMRRNRLFLHAPTH